MNNTSPQMNPFALYNPSHNENASDATIVHTGLSRRTVDTCCVGAKALQLANRPVAMLYALLDSIATESATSAHVIYDATTKTTLNMRTTKPVDIGALGDMVTIHVENSRGLQPDDLLTVAPFGQQFWVRSVPTRTSIDARRVGNFPSTPIKAGSILLHTGNSVPEGSMRRLGHHHYMAKYKSQSFIVRNGHAATGSAQAALKAKDGCSDIVLSGSREEMIMDHAADINKILLYGQSFHSMENGLPFTMGDGIISAIRMCAPQNVINIAAPIETKVLGRLIQGLQRVPAVNGLPDTLQIYCDYTSFEAWQELGKAEAGIMIHSGSTEINMQFLRFVMGGKAVEIIYDEGMDENAASEGLSQGFMYIFNPSSVVIDYLPERRGITASYKGMHAGEQADYNSADITAESILSEFHIKHVAPHANAVITGFNSDMVIRRPQVILGEASSSYFTGSCSAEDGIDVEGCC